MIPIGIAAGQVKYAAGIRRLVQVPSDILSSVTLGSYTVESRDGNPGNNAFWCDQASFPTSLNSLGLPNYGIDLTLRHLGEMIAKIQQSGKIARVSIAGKRPEDYEHLARKLLDLGLPELELNLGCPNVRDAGVPERIVSFMPDVIGEILRKVDRLTDAADAPSVSVKLSIYSDPYLLKEVAELLSEMRHVVKAVVTCNTFPNASGFSPDGKLLIDASNGYGGLAGAALKYIALGQVRQFRDNLHESIEVYGVGGVSSGQDVLDMERAGASRVQIGTAFFQSGDPSIFQRIMLEYAALMD